jgi:hypothetical protein
MSMGQDIVTLLLSWQTVMVDVGEEQIVITQCVLSSLLTSRCYKYFDEMTTCEWTENGYL